uniref:Uncharacterized protein n=1 Tax=Panagrolaimus superbus TaxID=310955 RepID=A0A914YYY3_9BILA
MKGSLFAAALLLMLHFEGIFSQCDSRGLKGLKQCYGNLINTDFSALNNPANNRNFSNDVANHPLCKIHTDKMNCLGSYEATCMNIAAFSQAFGINNRQTEKLCHKQAVNLMMH